MSKKCRDGLLRYATLHLHYCDEREFAEHLREMADWAEQNCWPAGNSPGWLQVARFNKGGGGPCAPRSLTEVTETFPLVPAVPHSSCPCKD